MKRMVDLKQVSDGRPLFFRRYGKSRLQRLRGLFSLLSGHGKLHPPRPYGCVAPSPGSAQRLQHTYRKRSRAGHGGWYDSPEYENGCPDRCLSLSGWKWKMQYS